MQRTRKTVWVGLVCLLFQWVPCEAWPSNQENSNSPALRRWAVICTPELQASGLSDLVTAKLSELNFELVERELLAEATKELALSNYMQTEIGRAHV